MSGSPVTRSVDLLGRYVNWLSDCYRAGPRYLAVLRIAFGLYVLVQTKDYTWPARVPPEFFRPVQGPFHLLTAPPPLPVLVAVQVAVAVLAVLLVLGFRTVAVSVLLSLAMITGSGVVYAYGKVDHGILVELLPLAMAAAGWGAAWSLDSRRRGRRGPTSGFPVLLYGLVLGFAMFTAALPKALNGWLDPSRHATRGYVAEYAWNGADAPMEQFFLGMESPVFWKLLDYTTLAVEGGLLVALLFPPLFRLVLLALVGFHIGVYLSLDIGFESHAFVYYPFFYAVWAWAVTAAGRRRRHDGTTGVDEPAGVVSRP